MQRIEAKKKGKFQPGQAEKDKSPDLKSGHHTHKKKEKSTVSFAPVITSTSILPSNITLVKGAKFPTRGLIKKPSFPTNSALRDPQNKLGIDKKPEEGKQDEGQKNTVVPPIVENPVGEKSVEESKNKPVQESPKDDATSNEKPVETKPGLAGDRRASRGSILVTPPRDGEGNRIRRDSKRRQSVTFAVDQPEKPPAAGNQDPKENPSKSPPGDHKDAGKEPVEEPVKEPVKTPVKEPEEQKDAGGGGVGGLLEEIRRKGELRKKAEEAKANNLAGGSKPGDIKPLPGVANDSKAGVGGQDPKTPINKPLTPRSKPASINLPTDQKEPVAGPGGDVSDLLKEIQAGKGLKRVDTTKPVDNKPLTPRPKPQPKPAPINLPTDIKEPVAAPGGGVTDLLKQIQAGKGLKRVDTTKPVDNKPLTPRPRPQPKPKPDPKPEPQADRKEPAAAPPEVNDLLKEIQAGRKLKPVDNKPLPPATDKREPVAAPPEVNDLLKEIQAGRKLKPVDNKSVPPADKKEPVAAPPEVNDLLKEIQAGRKLKPVDNKPLPPADKKEPVAAPPEVNDLLKEIQAGRKLKPVDNKSVPPADKKEQAPAPPGDVNDLLAEIRLQGEKKKALAEAKKNNPAGEVKQPEDNKKPLEGGNADDGASGKPGKITKPVWKPPNFVGKPKDGADKSKEGSPEKDADTKEDEKPREEPKDKEEKPKGKPTFKPPAFGKPKLGANKSNEASPEKDPIKKGDEKPKEDAKSKEEEKPKVEDKPKPEEPKEKEETKTKEDSKPKFGSVVAKFPNLSRGASLISSIADIKGEESRASENKLSESRTTLDPKSGEVKDEEKTGDKPKPKLSLPKFKPPTKKGDKAKEEEAMPVVVEKPKEEDKSKAEEKEKEAPGKIKFKPPAFGKKAAAVVATDAKVENDAGEVKPVESKPEEPKVESQVSPPKPKFNKPTFKKT